MFEFVCPSFTPKRRNGYSECLHKDTAPESAIGNFSYLEYISFHRESGIFDKQLLDACHVKAGNWYYNKVPFKG